MLVHAVWLSTSAISCYKMVMPLKSGVGAHCCPPPAFAETDGGGLRAGRLGPAAKPQACRQRSAGRCPCTERSQAAFPRGRVLSIPALQPDPAFGRRHSRACCRCGRTQQGAWSVPT